jgi:hypothetical protein
MTCRQRLRRLYTKYFFSSSSHNLLNYLTLEIQDPEIARKFTEHRLESYNRLLRPFFILSSMLFIWRIAALYLFKVGDVI